MKEDKLALIKKLLGSSAILDLYSEKDNIYLISLYNILSIYSKYESTSRNWQLQKMKLNSEGYKFKDKIPEEFKLRSKTGIYMSYKHIFRVLLTLPYKELEKFRMWGSELIVQRIDEVFNPKLTFYRGIHYLIQKGYKEEEIKILFNNTLKNYFNLANQGGYSGGSNIEYKLMKSDIYLANQS